MRQKGKVFCTRHGYRITHILALYGYLYDIGAVGAGAWLPATRYSSIYIACINPLTVRCSFWCSDAEK